MIHHGVLPSEVGRQAGLSCGDGGPYLGADGTAHAVGEMVIEHTREGGLEAVAHGGTGVAVLVPGEVAMLAPLGGDMLGLQAGAVHLHGVEIEELEIQVVVGQSALGIQAGVPGQIHDLHAALHGRTQGTADVLTQPAGVYLVV